ncbi:MAG: SEC-C metal-binding domain-containing protein [Candidatus Omnitrophota bacterium]
MKIGRNDPCPCGSEKKYKKCCLNTPPKNPEESASYIFDYHHFVFSKYFRELGKNLDILREELTRSFINNFLSILAPPVQFSSEQAIEILEKFLESCEKEISKIVVKHHVYYWVHLYRRLSPENTFKHKQIVSVGLYREIMETAFVKYGSLDIENDFVVVDSVGKLKEVMGGEYYKVLLEELGVKKLESYCKNYDFGNKKYYIKKFSIEQFIELFALERLCCEFHYLTVCFRRACKGGRLIIKDMESYYVLNDDDTERLIDSFDERNNDKTTVATTTLGIVVSDLDAGDEFNCILPRYNIERTTCKERPNLEIVNKDMKEANLNYAPNFSWCYFNLGNYYHVNKFMQESFRKHYGFRFEVLVLFIYIISLDVIACVQKDYQITYQFLQRAYQNLKNVSELVKYISRMADRIKTQKVDQLRDIKISKKDIINIVKFLTLEKTRDVKIDLITRGPRKLFIPTRKGCFLMDYSAIPQILFTIMHPLKEDAGEKGAIFEKYVANVLIKQEQALWAETKKLSALDGSKKEIDIAIIKNKCLFLCELKSTNRSFAFEKGTKGALNYRKNEQIKALKQVQDKTDWLASRRKGKNYFIPDEVNIIIPLVLTPFVEYIWSLDEYLWLTNKIPRILTLEEFKKILLNPLENKIFEKKYIRYVK